MAHLPYVDMKADGGPALILFMHHLYLHDVFSWSQIYTQHLRVFSLFSSRPHTDILRMFGVRFGNKLFPRRKGFLCRTKHKANPQQNEY